MKNTIQKIRTIAFNRSFIPCNVHAIQNVTNVHTGITPFVLMSKYTIVCTNKTHAALIMQNLCFTGSVENFVVAPQEVWRTVSGSPAFAAARVAGASDARYFAHFATSAALVQATWWSCAFVLNSEWHNLRAERTEERTVRWRGWCVEAFGAFGNAS